MATERRIQVYPDPSTLTYLGADTDGEMATVLNLSLDVFGEMIARATKDNESLFNRAEWNMIADVCNGTMFLGGMDPHSQLYPNVEDGHRLDGTGDKWFDKGADKAVAALSKKLQSLDTSHAWAVIFAVGWFWRHCEDINPSNDDWWTLRFRQKSAKSKRNPRPVCDRAGQALRNP